MNYLSKINSFVKANPKTINEIKKSDIIVYAPGTQHSSLLPTYLSKGISHAIKSNKNALKFFITNIGADFENPCYIASEYLKNAHRYLNLSDKNIFSYQDLFNYVFVNKLSKNIKNSNYVKYDNDGFTDINVELLNINFEKSSKPGIHNGKIIVDQIFHFYNTFKPK